MYCRNCINSMTDGWKRIVNVFYCTETHVVTTIFEEVGRYTINGRLFTRKTFSTFERSLLTLELRWCYLTLCNDRNSQISLIFTKAHEILSQKLVAVCKCFKLLFTQLKISYNFLLSLYLIKLELLPYDIWPTPVWR